MSAPQDANATLGANATFDDAQEATDAQAAADAAATNRDQTAGERHKPAVIEQKTAAEWSRDVFKH
jgi:hypothetical protein